MLPADIVIGTWNVWWRNGPDQGNDHQVEQIPDARLLPIHRIF